MAINVAVDLEPFSRINPCGYAELEMTDLNRLGVDLDLEGVWPRLLPHFLHHLGFDDVEIVRGEDEIPAVATTTAG